MLKNMGPYFVILRMGKNITDFLYDILGVL